MIDDKRLLEILKAYDSEPDWNYEPMSKQELTELIHAYQHHKRVLPLHQAIARACKDLGY